MENSEVVQVSDEVADLLDIQRQHPFRIRAYRNAAALFAINPRPLAGIVEDDSCKLSPRSANCSRGNVLFS